MQNLALAMFIVPQFGHFCSSGLPQFWQNFAPDGFSNEQFRQFII